MAASSLPKLVFVDANGNHFIVKDVLAAGDCALLALLNHPNFNAPVSDCLELRRAIVSSGCLLYCLWYGRGPFQHAIRLLSATCVASQILGQNSVLYLGFNGLWL